MTDITVTPIVEEDLDEIIKIGLSTKELWVENSGPVYYEKKQLVSFIKSPNDIYLVAKINGGISGYCLVSVNIFLKEAYWIDIAVKEKHRGLGIGTLLYQRTMEELNKRDCDWCWALVQEDNQNMQQFIEKQGFKKGKKFFFYYKIRPYV